MGVGAVQSTCTMFA